MLTRSTVVIFFAALVGTAIAEPQLLPTPAPAPAPISPLQCTTPPIQCCDEIGPLELLANIVDPVLELLGITPPPLGTLVATGCTANLLDLPCSNGATNMCCTLVVPNSDIGVDCQVVTPLLGTLDPGSILSSILGPITSLL